jgi:general secretion pathway protein I
LSRATPSPTDRADRERGDSGFTIIEALIALAIVAVSIAAIGSVMSTNVRGVQSLEKHVALMQTAQMVMATAIPQRAKLAPGVLSGQLRDYRWQVDVGPLGGGWVVPDADVAWVPELVKVRVRAPGGGAIDLETVRLMARPRQ